MNLEGADVTAAGEPDFHDRWIMSRLYQTVAEATRLLEDFKFSDYAGLCYDFFWHEFCDWYLELIKDRISSRDPAALHVLYTVLNTCCHILHPMIPFITENLRNTLNELAGVTPESASLSFSKWPEPAQDLIDEDLHAEMDMVRDVIRGIRNIRAKLNIQPKLEIDAVLSLPDEESLDMFTPHAATVEKMAGVRSLRLQATRPERLKNTAVEVIGELTISVPLEGFIDIDDEKARLRKQLDQKKSLLEKSNRKLGNHGFLEKAPEEIVNREWERKRSLQKEIRHLEAFLDNLE
jgi:valyl-tRNA synthetase